MSGVGLLLRAWKNTTIIMFSLLSIISLSVYYGNLFDRVTINLFQNSSYVIQYFGDGIGWIISIVLSLIIMIGPFNYWISISSNSNLDLIISMILIYFFVSFNVGKIMHGFNNIGGFILGFLTPIYINYTLYGILYTLSSSINNGTIIMSFVKGFYGTDDIILFLLIGGIINGIVLGIFGYFWTVILNTYFPNKIQINTKKVKKCPPASNFCVNIKKKSAINTPIIFKK